jgi:GT2 family glycosyltransferase
MIIGIGYKNLRRYLNLPKTAITILHYKNDPQTYKCIDAIRKYTKAGTYYIVIVDNGSPIPFKLRKTNKDIEVIRNEFTTNVPGMNTGFYHALYNLSFNPEYIVYMDNDVFVLKGWLPPLIKAMELDPTVGTVGPKQWDKDRKNHHAVGYDLMGALYQNAPNERTSVVWMTGSVVMHRAEMMKKIGLHDERYRTVCSDSDYNIHARDRGWEILFEPASEVIHIGGGSYEGKHPDGDADRTEFIRKWAGVKFQELLFNIPFCSQTNTHLKITLEKIPLENKVKMV